MDSNSIISQKVKRLSFIDEIRVKTDVERQRLLKLQRDYEEGLISEDDMTEEQVIGIEKLYKEQIKALKDKNEADKIKIQNLRKRLANS